MVKLRRRKAIEILKQNGVDAILFSDMTNVRYLSGFTGTEGCLIVADEESWLLCDSRYTLQASQQCDCTVVEYKTKNSTLIELLTQNKFKRVGFESAAVSYSEFQKLDTSSGKSFEWVALDDVSSLRTVKDESEISLIEKATSISARAFEDISQSIVPGVTEKEVALALEIAIRKRGGDDKSFEFIVASGIRGAMPHGVASEKIIEPSDLVTIDFGGRYEGYHSDETITCAAGHPEDKLRNVFDVVLEAHDRAIAMIKPGVPLKDIDAVARDFITERGFGAYFGHGLGHGIGLEVHEAPRVSPLSKGLTETGMVFTVEPGIYLPGFGGVRIEDIVVVTEDGCRILTHLPKNFRLLN